MSKADEASAKVAAGRGGGRLFRSWVVIAVLLLSVAVIGGGAGYWYFFLAKRPAPESAQVAVPVPTAPLPFYLELKPFVVSMVNSAGTPHFVQLGLNLTLSGTEAANAVNGVLPEVQDAMRQTVLTFKVDDVVTPTGIDKMREAMITNVNQVLLQRLGAERVKQLNGGANGVVQAIYFTTLIVE